MAGNSPTLRWDSFQGNAEKAMLGNVTIAMIVPLEECPETWAYSVSGIDVKWIAKGNGHVKGKIAARRAVRRVWSVWCQKAGLSEGAA